jgi:surface carbohydrate biosynthesis protein
MIPRILYLPVETIVRDLDANLLLGYEAMERGYEVVVGRKEEVRQFAIKRGGGVYLSKHWEKTFPYKHDHPNRANYCYLGFHPEGLVYVADDLVKKMNVTGETEKLDIKFVYGSKQKELLVKENPLLKKIIKEVGHPRFDLLRPSYHFLYRENVEKIWQKYGKYILINTNFTSGNPSKFYKKSYLERKNEDRLKKWGIPLSESEVEFINNRVKYIRSMMELYRDMCVQLAMKFPNTTFILRPHPSENHESYHSNLNGIPNLKVIHEGNVFNWIIGSEALIQSGCTTAIESWVAGKNVLRYNPIEGADKFESPLPNEFGKHVKSLDELVLEVSKILTDNTFYKSKDRETKAKLFIESIDGELSVQRILNYIEESVSFASSSDNTKESFIRNYYHFDDSNSKKKYASRKISRFLRSQFWLMKIRFGETKAHEILAEFQKFPGIRINYIRKFLTLLASSDKKNNTNIQIHAIDMDTFLLKK